MQRRSNQDAGISLLETALFLPLLLLIIFIMVWLGVILNARASLSAGMSDVLRSAATRGDSRLMGQDLLRVVKEFRAAPNSAEALAGLTPYISAPPARDPVEYFNKCFATEVFRGTRLADLPPQYLYALIYLSEALKLSLGPAARFPCWAGPKTGAPVGCTEEPRGPGCVSCRLMNPDTLDFQQADGPPPPDRIALECRYEPSSFITDPVVRLLSLFSPSAGGFYLVQRRFFDVNEVPS